MSQYALPFTLPAVFSADNFVIADGNRDAWGWVQSWPNWPSHALILYGPQGSGKTHLGHVWAERADGAILNEDDTRPEPTALKGAWLIEHIEALPERWLLHTLNAAREQKASLLLTSTPAPALLPFKLPDLTSRLLALPAVSLGEADDALLAAALRKQFADRQIKVGDEVIQYLLPRMERSLAGVSSLVDTLDAGALAEKKNLTIPFVKRLLGPT